MRAIPGCTGRTLDTCARRIVQHDSGVRAVHDLTIIASLMPSAARNRPAARAGKCHGIRRPRISSLFSFHMFSDLDGKALHPRSQSLVLLGVQAQHGRQQHDQGDKLLAT